MASSSGGLFTNKPTSSATDKKPGDKLAATAENKPLFGQTPDSAKPSIKIKPNISVNVPDKKQESTGLFAQKNAASLFDQKPANGQPTLFNASGATAGALFQDMAPKKKQSDTET